MVASETSSPGRWLESGFLCVRQGRYAEGLAFFALAHERLSPNQADLAAVLDAFIQSQKTYLQAQEELLQASRHFARADAEQQVQLAALENFLPILLEESNKISPHVDGLQYNARGNQSLYVLPPLLEDLNSNQVPMPLLVQNHPTMWEKGPFGEYKSPRLAAPNPGREASPPDTCPPDRVPPLPIRSLDLALERTVEDNREHGPLPPSPFEESTPLPALSISCFGRFEVKRLGRPVALCSNRHGQTILRYLVAQADHCATSDTLMTLLWPEDDPEVVQPRLHTAICALRRSLNHDYAFGPGGGYILCKNRTYCLTTAIPIQTDVDQFLHYYQAGRQTNEERVTLYEKACQLYTGPFLPEDTYADWSFLQREHLSRIYIDMCRTLTDHYLQVKRYADAEKWATAVLKENHCDELAHRQLIQVYAAQGHRSEALQQYQRCERILREELAVQPLPETVLVIQMMLKSDPSSEEEGKI